jgi:hypothetical protein
MTFFRFLVIGFFKKNVCFFFSISLGIIYFCTMDGFFRILEKTSSELIWTRLIYNTLVHLSISYFIYKYFVGFKFFFFCFFFQKFLNCYLSGF